MTQETNEKSNYQFKIELINRVKFLMDEVSKIGLVYTMPDFVDDDEPDFFTQQMKNLENTGIGLYNKIDNGDFRGVEGEIERFKLDVKIFLESFEIAYPNNKTPKNSIS